MNARWEGTPNLDLAEAFLEACAMDVAALKPGNVSHASPGHGMTAEDFLASAQAAAPWVTDPGLAPGARIHRAVEATRQRVGCNTNLGILLLAVPLVHAAQYRQPDETLAASLGRSLEAFDLEQTDQVYRAIRLAAPGGLGKSPRHDVHAAPTVPLVVSMREAGRRDCIARQYANGFADIFAEGRRALAQVRGRWHAGPRNADGMAAASMLYMHYLSSFPDSHIQRKQGARVAEDVRQRARACLGEIQACDDWQEARALLAELDASLKAEDINPGTSADLTVATWLVDRLDGPAPNTRAGLAPADQAGD